MASNFFPSKFNYCNIIFGGLGGGGGLEDGGEGRSLGENLPPPSHPQRLYKLVLSEQLFNLQKYWKSSKPYLS